MTPKQLEQQNETLRRIIGDIWWMARRYADGRSTYAAGMYNQAVDVALRNGVKLEGDNGKLYATDGKFGEWVPEANRFKGELYG